MADTGIFATTAEILRKAGAGASAVSKDEAYTNDYVAQAESYINILTGTDYSDTGVFAGLKAGKKNILKEAASNLAAIYVVQYDITGYASTREAENIMNTNWRRFVQCIKLLIDRSNATFLSLT